VNIREVFTKYKIMPFLQEHLFGVAAVARLITINFSKPLDIGNMTQACLLHDIGNIIKFKLGAVPQALEPEGLKYWQKVKEEFIKKYGNNEHIASKKIAKELKVSDCVLELIDTIGFSKSEKNYKSKDFEKKICAYSDQRVGPYEVLSLEERLKEGKERFRKKRGRSDQEEFFHQKKYLEKLEKQIFENCKIKPEDVNDENIKNIVNSLKEFIKG
jgi:hypothetical protein